MSNGSIYVKMKEQKGIIVQTPSKELYFIDAEDIRYVNPTIDSALKKEDKNKNFEEVNEERQENKYLNKTRNKQFVSTDKTGNKKIQNQKFYVNKYIKNKKVNKNKSSPIFVFDHYKKKIISLIQEFPQTSKKQKMNSLKKNEVFNKDFFKNGKKSKM